MKIEAYMKKFVSFFVVFIILSTIILAKGRSIEGVLLDLKGEKATEITLLLLDQNGTEVQRVESKGGLRGKGKFEFKKVLAGTYTISVDAGNLGNTSIPVVVMKDNIKNLEIKLSLAQKAKPKKSSSKEKNPIPKDEEIVKDKDYIINELSFEVKKMTSEIKHLSSELEDLKALSKMWVNPLAIYSKEIILKNGSTVFGKIVYQDEKTLKVESLVGYLVIDRENVIRVVDNVVTDEQQEYVPEQIRDSYSPPPMPKLAQPKYTSSNMMNRKAGKTFSANCVLVGNISEKKDSRGNIIFTGEIKNIGGRRADFAKLDFVFRKNWSGETKTLTTFVRGTYQTFESGITTDATLLPGALGTFELYVPHSFGSFIGYSYLIDWEEYQ